MSDLQQIFDKTSLDLEHPSPEGGPIHAPTYNFFHENTSQNPYYIPGTTTTELVDSLKITSLDVEESEAGTAQGGEGGPMRTNSGNRLGTVGDDGRYIVKGSSPNPLSPTPGGKPLEGRNGVQEFTLNAYTPHETYMQSVVTYKNRYKII